MNRTQTVKTDLTLRRKCWLQIKRQRDRKMPTGAALTGCRSIIMRFLHEGNGIFQLTPPQRRAYRDKPIPRGHAITDQQI